MFDPDGKVTMAAITEAMWGQTPDKSNSYGTIMVTEDLRVMMAVTRGHAGGGSLPYSSTVSYGGVFTMGDGTYTMPPLILSGFGGGSGGLDYVKSDYNSAVLGSGIRGAQADWNTQQARSDWQTAINETEIGKSIGNMERFLFLDMPMQFAGGTLLSAGWKAVGAGKFLIGIVNNVYAKVAPRIFPQVYTKSSLALGRQMHTAYKAGLADGINTFKEFNKVPGIRPDFVDFSTKTIYELKPFNPKQIQLGTKQLLKYKNAFEAQYGGTWNTVLDFY